MPSSFALVITYSRSLSKKMHMKTTRPESFIACSAMSIVALSPSAKPFSVTPMPMPAACDMNAPE